MDKQNKIKFALPKGRMQKRVLSLMKDAGINIYGEERGYRPSISLENVEVKILKPQNIIQMLHSGSRDFGFAGADWVKEHGANVIELIDTKLNPVSLVAASPKSFLINNKLPKKKIRIASEYENLTKAWINEKKLDATFVRSYGATEVFPPEDADCIVDNTSTGSTLKANNLEIVDTLMTSSTRLYANENSLKKPYVRDLIESFTLLIGSVLEARNRVMIEVNVNKENLEKVINILPSMRGVTVSELSRNSGFSLKSAVPTKNLTSLIPKIKEYGGSDIVVTKASQIVP